MLFVESVVGDALVVGEYVYIGVSIVSSPLVSSIECARALVTRFVGEYVYIGVSIFVVPSH